MGNPATLILSAVLAIVAVGAIQAQQTAALVEDVQVIGYRRLTKEDILKHVKTKPGEPYSEELIKRDFDAVLHLGWFDKTKSRVIREDRKRGGVVVVFEVAEIPLVLDVTFEGLGDDVKAAELVEAFRQQNIKVARDCVYELVEIRKAIRTIKEIFASRGWPDYGITVRQEHTSASYTSITFVVERRARF
jgi:outer membrane protein assembly factor BamA